MAPKFALSPAPAAEPPAHAPTPEALRVSAAAARRIAEILAGEKPGAMLRVAVEGGGCSGFQYRFAIAETAEADDNRIPAGAAIVLVDPVSAPFLAGSELDFVTELIGQSFQIRNPNATASCGCGTSFNL
jgi:iron-sulfur cluster assembly accessory protein